MKRIFAIALALCSLLGALGCSSLEAMEEALPPKTETETAAETKIPADTFEYPEVKNPLTWEKIRAIPIANGSMTVDELRQICVDFLWLQLSFEWTPDRDHAYKIETEMHNNKPMKFEKGTLYAGNPYRAGSNNGQSGNVYTVMELYDPETGVLSSEGLTTDQLTALVTNHCSSSCYWAWSRVINTMYGAADNFTKAGLSNGHMVQSKGFLPVGPYTYSGVSSWSDGDGTRAVCEANGQQVMYRSYANTLPADGLIQLYPKGTSQANHVQMIAAKPEVAYLPDGSIDGANSFITIMEQTSTLTKTTREDGETVYVEGGIDKRVSFSQMFKSSYIPFTFAEFLGTDLVEDAEFFLTHKSGEEITSLAQLRDSELTANYPISSVTVVSVDENGNETYRRYGHPARTGSYSYNLFTVVYPAAVTREKNGEKFTVQAILGNGAEVVLYQSK